MIGDSVIARITRALIAELQRQGEISGGTPALIEQGTERAGL